MLKLVIVALAALFAVRVATVRERAELSAALDYAVANSLATTSTLAEATPMLLEEIGSLLGRRARRRSGSSSPARRSFAAWTCATRRARR